MTGKSEQTFSFEIVSCLLAALSENGATVGSKHYKIMAQIDGTKSASGYEHLFRSVKARAKEINEQIASGTIDATTPSAKKTTSKTATPSTGKKRARKSKAESEEAGGDEEAGDDEEAKTPCKKSKVKEEKSMEEDDSFL